MTYLTSNFHNGQGHDKQGNTEKRSQIGRDEEDMMTACHVGFWNVNGEMGEI